MNLFSKKIWQNHTLYDFLLQQLKKNIYICEQSSNLLYLQSRQNFRKLNL